MDGASRRSRAKSSCGGPSAHSDRSPRSTCSRSCSAIAVAGGPPSTLIDQPYYRCSDNRWKPRSVTAEPLLAARGARGARGRRWAGAHPPGGGPPRRPARGLDEQPLPDPRGPPDRGSATAGRPRATLGASPRGRSCPAVRTSPVARRADHRAGRRRAGSTELSDLALARYELILEARRRPDFERELNEVRARVPALVEQLFRRPAAVTRAGTRPTCWLCSTA